MQAPDSACLSFHLGGGIITQLMDLKKMKKMKLKVLVNIFMICLLGKAASNHNEVYFNEKKAEKLYLRNLLFV